MISGRWVGLSLVLSLWGGLLPAAANSTEAGGGIQWSESEQENRLLLEDEKVYEGMDRAYRDGYEPKVENNRALIILPLCLSEQEEISKIQAAVNLGAVEQSPFVFKNYQRTFYREEEEQTLFLVRFELELQEQRVNGAYPVVITVYAPERQTMPKQSFTVFVRITDGEEKVSGDSIDEVPEVPSGEPDREEFLDIPDSGIGNGSENFPEASPGSSGEESEPEQKPVSEPKVILSATAGLPDRIHSGDEIELRAVLKNTSKQKYVQNMTVTVTCEAAGIVLEADSNVWFFERLDPQKTLELPLHFRINGQTEAGKYTVNLELSYDNPEAESLTSAAKLELNVVQKPSMELEVGETAAEINAGDSMVIPVQAVNLGRGQIQNVRCMIEVPGLSMEKSLFLGNLEGGSAVSGELKVFAGMVNPEAVDEERYGKTDGMVVLTYQDTNGEEYRLEEALALTVKPLKVTPAIPSEEPRERVAAQLLFGGLILVLFLAMSVGIPILRRHKSKGEI